MAFVYLLFAEVNLIGFSVGCFHNRKFLGGFIFGAFALLFLIITINDKKH